MPFWSFRRKIHSNFHPVYFERFVTWIEEEILKIFKTSIVYLLGSFRNKNHNSFPPVNLKRFVRRRYWRRRRRRIEEEI